MTTPPVVLMTGASSGIGKAAALLFRRQGWTVVAGARRVDAMADLRLQGCHTLHLDVTDATSREQFVAQALHLGGRLDVLVNNAGYGPLGPIEVFDLADAKRVFETNVFGLLALSQLVAPYLRQQGSGRIIHIGSMGGDFTTPYAGIYHATKYALEAISDAMRFELAPFGVQVALVKPAAVNTPMAASALETPSGMSGVYAPYMQAMLDMGRQSLANPRMLIAPEQVAKAIVRAATARRPQARYRVGIGATVFTLLRRWLPIRWWDGLWRRMLKPAQPPQQAGEQLARV